MKNLFIFFILPLPLFLLIIPGSIYGKEIYPDNPCISYSDYYHLKKTPKKASFNRKLSSLIAGQTDFQNPFARVRFRTNAKSVKITLYYNELDGHNSWPGKGAVLVDGKPECFFSSPFPVTPGIKSNPGITEIVFSAKGKSFFKTYEIIMPATDSVDFQKISVNDEALFENPHPRPFIRWLAYGDSITQGSGMDNNLSAFTYLVASVKKYELINLGFGGRQLTPLDGSDIAIKGNFITVLMGANDAAHNKRPEKFQENLTAFIKNLRKKNDKIPVYLITPIFCGIPSREKLLGEYRKVIKIFYDEKKFWPLFLIDGLKLMEGVTINNFEEYFIEKKGIHPNEKGNKIIAENLIKILPDK